MNMTSKGAPLRRLPVKYPESTGSREKSAHARPRRIVVSDTGACRSRERDRDLSGRHLVHGGETKRRQEQAEHENNPRCEKHVRDWSCEPTSNPLSSRVPHSCDAGRFQETRSETLSNRLVEEYVLVSDELELTGEIVRIIAGNAPAVAHDHRVERTVRKSVVVLRSFS